MSENLFGERLRALRKQAHLTQQAVADRLSIHRTAYTKYETGVVTPDQQGLVRLAELYGVTVDYLLGREEIPFSIADNVGEKIQLTLQEQQLVQMFRQLPYMEQQALIQRVLRTFKMRKK